MFETISKLESQILRLLAVNYPLTAKNILEKIENNYSLAGVHRALASLLQKRIIHKSRQFYQLQTDTMIEEKKQIQGVLDRYIEAENYHLFQRKESVYYFETLPQLDSFWNAVIEKWFNFYPPKKYAYLQKQPFPWFAVLQLNEERRVIRDICRSASEFKTLCVKSPANLLLGPVYQQYPNSYFFTPEDLPDVNHAFAVFGDHVIETHYPPEVKAIFEGVFQLESAEFLFEAILRLAEPGEFCLKVSKNPEKAQQYRQLIQKWAP